MMGKREEELTARIDMEEKKEAAYRLAEEISVLADELSNKARQLMATTATTHVANDADG